MPARPKNFKRPVAERSTDPVADKREPAPRIQYGALAYRFTNGTGLEILLITSRNTKRWIIPKGWPIKGMKPSASAAQEAFEEAGVRGKVSRRSIGHYVYAKLLKTGTKAVRCELQVYALDVYSQEVNWPEEGQREMRWCQPEEAIALAGEIELQQLVASFVAHLSTLTITRKKPGSSRLKSEQRH